MTQNGLEYYLCFGPEWPRMGRDPRITPPPSRPFWVQIKVKPYFKNRKIVILGHSGPFLDPKMA